METRAHQAEKFLKEGDKIRIEMVLRGREKAHRGFCQRKNQPIFGDFRKTNSYKDRKGTKKRTERIYNNNFKQELKLYENTKINLKTF